MRALHGFIALATNRIWAWALALCKRTWIWWREAHFNTWTWQLYFCSTIGSFDAIPVHCHMTPLAARNFMTTHLVCRRHRNGVRWDIAEFYACITTNANWVNITQCILRVFMHCSPQLSLFYGGAVVKEFSPVCSQIEIEWIFFSQLSEKVCVWNGIKYSVPFELARQSCAICIIVLAESCSRANGTQLKLPQKKEYKITIKQCKNNNRR